nr:reverse transcriptase domain-containing protein [Tanacetum cinerariifolium]
MRTRSQSRHNSPQQEALPFIFEPLWIELLFLEDQFQEDPPPEVPMVDNRTMAELLQEPTEGYEDAIVIPEIAANNFELKHGLINLSKSKVRQSLAKAVVAKVSTSSSTPTISSEVAELKDLVRALLLDKKNQSSAPVSSSTLAPVKAVEPNCVTCGGLGTLPSNTITNPKEELNGITTRSGVAYQGPTIPTPPKVVKQGTEVTKDQVQTPSSQSTAPVQPSVAQSETLTLTSEPVVAPVSAPTPNVKSSIPYPLRRDNERRRDQANEQIEKFYEIFKNMSFEISFTDALILMPKFASTLKALIGKKEKLSEMARTPMNEHCSTVILNKLPRKLGDLGKFLIPCEFPGMDECLALADLGASINLMPFSTGRALIDVHKGELTLRIGNENITYNLDQTVRYSANYNQMTANKIDVIEMACEEYSQEVLGFSDVTASGNPTLHDDPIVSTTSPTLTPFGDNEFLLFEEADAFLSLEDDPNSPKINPFYYDLEGDILLLEAILNSEPLPPFPNHEQYLPSFKKELKVCEAKTVKSFVDEPHEVELKDLPPHLEYAFLEGNNKLPIIIAKELEDEEKSALIKKEVEKLLDAGLIYPIFDSPWVSPVHCIPKKGGFIVVENEENELIPTRLVTRWRVCIDYQKLSEATRKDRFPLLFMDQMLERLEGNKFYCFLDGSPITTPFLLLLGAVTTLAEATISVASGTLGSVVEIVALAAVTTYKVFENMRRVGKGFSGVETPLFKGMLVGQEIKEEGDADEHVEDVTTGDDGHGDDAAAHGEVPTVTQEPSIPSPTPPTIPPQPPKDLPSTSQRVDTSKDTVMDDESNQGWMIDEMDKDDAVVLMDDKEEDKKVEEAKVDKGAQCMSAKRSSWNEFSSSMASAIICLCTATIGNTQNFYAAGAYQGIKETIILRGTTREETNSSWELTKIPQPQVFTTNEFTNFMKANDAILKNMKTNMTSLTNSNIELKNMFGQFKKMNTASSSGSGTLSCNTISNPKEDLKGIMELGAMFEKLDVHAQIWKNQRTMHGQAKVKSWKLLES